MTLTCTRFRIVRLFNRPGAHRAIGFAMMAVCSFAALVLMPRVAIAQFEAIAPTYVVVEVPEAAVRSQASSVWYSVALLKRSSVLRADGVQRDEWYRVDYPRGLAVIVSLDDAELSRDGTTVVLTRQPRLRALDIERPYTEDSYKQVMLDAPPSPGTELVSLGPIKNRAGEIEGYKVAAPTGCKGFIRKSDVRDATPAEVRAFRISLGEIVPGEEAVNRETSAATNEGKGVADENGDGAASGDKADSDASPAQRDDAEQGEAASDEDEEAWPDGEWEEEGGESEPDVYLTGPTYHAPNDGELTDGEVTSKPVESADTAAEQTRQPHLEMIAPTQSRTHVDIPEAPTSDETPRRVLTLRELEQAFKTVMAQPIDDAEFSTLIDEYERFEDSFEGDSAAVRLREHASQRIDLLAFRAELREHMQHARRIESSMEDAETEAVSVARRLADTRAYVVVGRLATSAIYDGDALPLMYRIRAVDARGGHTIAYIPGEQAHQLGLDGKLGKIVGVKEAGDLRRSVVGTARVLTERKEGTRVRIIKADAVEVLGGEGR